jgi:dienelactone hydrolase
MDGLRDTAVPSLRFDLAGLPFDQWRRTLRERLLGALGLPPWWYPGLSPEGCRLLAVREEAWRDGPGYRWRRVFLQTEPDLWVPAFFIMPAEAALTAAGGRVPVVIACQGHAAAGMRLSLGLVPPEVYEQAIAGGDRDFALQAVRHGYACLALEMRSFGELRLPEDRARDAANSCARLSALALQVGRTLVGMRVWDVLAALDYLGELPQVDAGRIALTGNSGGGTVTLYAGAIEDRLAATAPSSAFCTFADSIQAVHHCACNFVPGLAGL